MSFCAQGRKLFDKAWEIENSRSLERHVIKFEMCFYMCAKLMFLIPHLCVFLLHCAICTHILECNRKTVKLAYDDFEENGERV